MYRPFKKRIAAYIILQHSSAEISIEQFGERIITVHTVEDVSIYDLHHLYFDLKRLLMLLDGQFNILNIRQEQEQLTRCVNAAAAAMSAADTELTERNDEIIYQLLEKVTVLEDFQIKVTFRNEQEVDQTINQPKRRKHT